MTFDNNNRIHDDVFGELNYWPGDDEDKGSWNKEEHFSLLGQKTRISLEAIPAQGPTQRQAQTYLGFKERQISLKAELQDALFEFYQEVRPSWLRFKTAENEDEIPLLSSSEQIWKLLTPRVLIFPLRPSAIVAGENDEDLVIQWETTWYFDGQLNVSYRDWEIISIDED